MRQIKLNLDGSDGLLYYGELLRVGENVCSQFVIALGEEYQGYHYLLTFQLNDGVAVYTEELIPVDNVITYDIPKEIIAGAGDLKVEFQAYEVITVGNNMVMKSAVTTLKVIDSLEGISQIIPADYIPWYLQAVSQASISTEKAGESLSSAVASKLSQDNAKVSETNSKASETNSKTSENNSKVSENNSKTSETNSKASENNAKTSENNAKTSETNSKTSETNAGNSASSIIGAVASSGTSASNALTSEHNAKTSENNAKTSETNSKTSETNSKTSENNAKTSETNAGSSQVITAQAMTDLLNMLGTNVATLVGGKLNPSQIPALSINDVFTIANVSLMTGLTAQRGDVAIIVPVDVVTDTYMLSADDSTILANWKKLGIAYVSNAGHSVTADSATDATTIGGHRIVVMTQSAYDIAYAGSTLNADTVYLISG